MRSLVRLILKKLLFKNRSIREYPAVRILNEQIREKVFLKSKSGYVDITENHAVVCQTPFYMAIWIAPDQLDHHYSMFSEIHVLRGETRIAKLSASLHQKINENDLRIVILKLEKARSYSLNYFYHHLLIRYFVRKRKITFKEGTIYGALYSYPRRVIVVSFKNYDYYNIFPMDFQCYVKESNIFLLGLRTTNITLQKILDEKRMVISDTDSVDLDTLYFLGKHHSSTPSALDKLPFKVIESERFKFPVPDFSSSYKEVEVLNSFPLGSHTFFIGKVLNSTEIRKESSSIYHFHFFGSLQATYFEIQLN